MINYPLGRKSIFSFSKISTAIVIMCVCSLSASADNATEFANFNRYAEANQNLQSSPRVVLMGNSITDFWPERGSHLFETHPEITGRGIAGQTSFQFLLRFREDVVNLHPEIVVINYGTNDIALNSGPYDEDKTFGNVLSMVDIARANGIKVVLASCLPAEGFSWRPEVTDAMDKIRSLNARVKAYAEENSIPYADYFSALINEEGTAMKPEYADEKPAVHPNRSGYGVMEQILLEAISQTK